MELSWESLELQYHAHLRLESRRMLMLMVAAQGAEEGWKKQRENLTKLLKYGLE